MGLVEFCIQGFSTLLRQNNLINHIDQLYQQGNIRVSLYVLDYDGYALS